MKMVVSSTTPSLSALSLDPELTEEEKMAKKREYWRIKKREQRAARAARLRQGILQARATAALRMKTQKHIALTTVPVGRSLTNHTENAQPLPNNSVSVTPHADEMKKESELETAVDLHSQPDQAICRDTKPPTFPPSPPTSQPESDPALTADSQATTLLAVASMKKLLEESLSTVAECKAVQAEIKTETTEDVPEKELKLNLPQLFFEKDEVAPIAADLTLQIKSWQPHTGALVQAGSSSLHLKDSSKICDTHSPLPTYSEVALHSTCGRSAQTTSNFAVIPSREASDDPSSPHIKKEDQQNCCSPEPPKLHHPPIDQLHPQQKHCEQQCQAQEECRNSNSVQSSLSSLQRKREYWKLMKRQQRARLKARQKETQGECRSRLSPRNIQAPGLISTVKGVNSPSKPAPPPKLSVASPTTHNAEQPRASLQVKLPIASASCSPRGQQNIMNIGPSQTGSDYLGAPESQKEASLGSQQWMSGSTDVDSGPSLSTLKPPDNPLSSINLQPIEPPGQSPNSALSPITVSCVQLQSHTHMIQPPNKLAPISTMGLPKPVPGESEEDFQRRKREYWRIKKKEQRARKAIQDKGIAQRRASKNWRRILPAPAPDPQTQDTGQWANPSEESEHLIRFSVEEEPGSFPYSNYTAPIEDESELLFADYGNNNGEEVPVSDTMWRNHYLMDYDPLNQLLVCMVCGELQYSHSLEEVKAHIDEAHPDTLTLEPGERQQILDTWNEQVSQRERFFTNQLQQHSCSLTEAHRNESAENGAAGVN
uniref:uncharacterized protein LOC109957221 n=1 Tax=Monopterus albus TaxID=43700 RepID=UPI0009B4A455|nr:uncharacterized protein LOC109957221 [Monopterus albus]